MRLYRGMITASESPAQVVEDLKYMDWSNVGIFWTEDRNVAINFALDPDWELGDPTWSKNLLILEADVDESNILVNYKNIASDEDIPSEVMEWKDTTSFAYHAEKEMTLRKGSPIEMRSVTFLGESGDQEILKLDFQKTVYASIISPVRDAMSEFIWNPDATLIPEVRDYILERMDEVLLQYNEEPIEYVKRAYIIGSITGRQYDDDADVDVNCFVDVDGMALAMGIDAESLRNSMRKSFIAINGENVPGSTHPLNFFLYGEDKAPPADGIFDLLEDRWIKRPGEDYPEDFDPYDTLGEAMERAENLMERIDKRLGAALRAEKAYETYGTNEHKRRMMRNMKALEKMLENVVEERHTIFDQVKKANGEAREAQMSVSNVVYKSLEMQGYLDKLHVARDYLDEHNEQSLTEMYGSG